MFEYLFLIPVANAHGLEGAEEATLGDVWGPILAIVLIIAAVAIRKLILSSATKSKK